MKNETYRIVWAVDPFVKPARFQRSAARAIEHLTKEGEAEVLPVHVMAAGIQERLRVAPADTAVKIRNRGQANLEGIIGKKNPIFKPLNILAKKFSSMKGGADELIRFSKKARADLIVLSTHANKGAKRWLLGSFAETLSTLSDLPILIAPPNWSPQGERKSVLFITDFSEESHRAFSRLLEMAKKQNWNITVFHHVDYPIYPAYEYAFASWTTYNEDLREVTELRRKEAEKLAAKGRNAGVAVDVAIHTAQTLNVTKSALKQLRKGYLFLALASQSGLVRSTVLGSTTRQLIRNSPAPVWVIHPQKSAEAQKTKGDLMPLPYARTEDSAALLL